MRFAELVGEVEGSLLIGVTLERTEGAVVFVGELVGFTVGLEDENFEGVYVGYEDLEGILVGDFEGSFVGEAVGNTDVTGEGRADGPLVGSLFGLKVGAIGFEVGNVPGTEQSGACSCWH